MESSIAKSNGIVAIRLKQILKENSISQKFIAEKMDIPQRVVSDMLNGRKLITVSDITKLVDILKPFSVGLVDLFESEVK